MTPTTEEVQQKPQTARKLVPISRITEDHGLQIRGAISESRVKDFETLIRENGNLDPLDAFYEDPINNETKFYLADGFHRIRAYKNVGAEAVPCNLRVGNRAEAIKFALRKNGHHGAPLTSVEKRNAALVAVTDPEVGKLTDLAIARMIGCSASLVASARRGESSGKVATAAKRERAEKKAAKSPKASPAPASTKAASGKRETETSGNPREVTAHERKPAPDNRPTKAIVLKQVEDYLNTDVLDEKDLLGLMKAKDGEWRWIKLPGDVLNLRVIGSAGREQVAVEVVVKEIGYDSITLKFEKGKLAVQGE